MCKGSRLLMQHHQSPPLPLKKISNKKKKKSKKIHNMLSHMLLKTRYTIILDFQSSVIQIELQDTICGHLSKNKIYSINHFRFPQHKIQQQLQISNLRPLLTISIQRHKAYSGKYFMSRQVLRISATGFLCQDEYKDEQMIHSKIKIMHET